MGAIKIIKNSNIVTPTQQKIQARLPLFINNQRIKERSRPPIIIDNSQPFKISNLNVLNLVRLNPYFSSITKVWYSEKGISIIWKKKNKIPIIPLAGVDNNLFNEAKEIGLDRNIKKLEKIVTINSNEIPVFSKKEVESAIKTKTKISVKVGPNNVHDILDSLGENH